MKTEPPSQSGGAFTLLEILVAMTILALIVGMLSVIVSEISGIWRSAEAHNQRRATGRALLQFIVRDLQMARLQTPYPGRSGGSNLQFIVSDPGAIPPGLLNPHAAFWQAPVAMDRSKGDLAEIGYFVRWDTASQPGTAKAQLCRFLVDPADGAHYRIYSLESDGTPAEWLNVSMIDSMASAAASQEYRGWFADDVIALWLRCLDGEGKPILETADGTRLNGGYGFDSSKGYINPTTSQRRPPTSLPASVEIVLVAVDARTAKRIRAPITATPNSPENFWKDKTTPGSVAHFIAGLPPEIASGVQVFSTRVVLRNAHP